MGNPTLPGMGNPTLPGMDNPTLSGMGNPTLPGMGNPDRDEEGPLHHPTATLSSHDKRNLKQRKTTTR